ncbi:hypothetical protein FQA39_LY11409 [Lamprigera yunnana]|nr:hypothetical protein FQA39_LY11409 [Lamprigera yunnana]
MSTINPQTFNENCPICGIKLQLLQISATQAVYLCGSNDCQYPLNKEFVVVNRRFEEIVRSEVANDRPPPSEVNNMINNLIDDALSVEDLSAASTSSLATSLLPEPIVIHKPAVTSEVPESASYSSERHCVQPDSSSQSNVSFEREAASDDNDEDSNEANDDDQDD